MQCFTVAPFTGASSKHVDTDIHGQPIQLTCILHNVPCKSISIRSNMGIRLGEQDIEENVKRAEELVFKGTTMGAVLKI